MRMGGIARHWGCDKVEISGRGLCLSFTSIIVIGFTLNVAPNGEIGELIKGNPGRD